MKMLKKLMAGILVCIMAAGLLVMPAFAEGENTEPTPAQKQIASINAARAKYGKNTLTESETLDQTAAEVLEQYVAYCEGRITDAEFNQAAVDISNKYKIGKFTVDGVTARTCGYMAVDRSDGLPDNFDWYAESEQNPVVTKDAVYIGNALTESNGRGYWVMFFARPLQ